MATQRYTVTPHPIGFTGTPIEQHDANTRPVFGEYAPNDDIDAEKKLW
jgi:type I site-specific restriction-modification system R (restriction) subunit